MASIFTTVGKATQQKGVFGTSNSAPIYLQFVPGVCVENITSLRTLNSYNDKKNINSILAIPHVRDGVKKKKTSLGSKDRYFPLMRGFVDVPAKGDPVLLCTIGGKRYYLGPLNTDNNPNFNVDNLYEPELSLGITKKDVEQNEIIIRGESRNFIKTQHERLTKTWNPKLDSSFTIHDTHGDMLMEGRHGNSIRIGSRSKNPYIFLSNGRHASFNYETFADGSLIAITEKGSLNQHFGGYYKQRDDNNLTEFVNGFTLSSDFVDSVANEDVPTRLMSKLISSVNGDVDAQQLIYEYGSLKNQNQILFSSDRITINTKNDDIYLSSNKDIHIGTKRHLTISTNENFIVESNKTYLGNPNVEGKVMDNLVLGNKLKEVLKSIVGLFGKIEILTQMGNQKPLPTIQPDINQTLSDIETILSDKHFIEE